MKLIFCYMRRRDKLLCLAVIGLIVVQVLLETWIPTQMSQITTMLQTGGSTYDAVLKIGLQMIMSAVGAFICACCAGFLISTIGCGCCESIRSALYKKVIGLSSADVTSFGASTLIVRCTNDVSYVQSFLEDCLQPLVQAPILLAAVFLRMSFSNSAWRGLWITAIVVLAILLLYISLASLIYVKKSGILRDKVASYSREHVYGIRVVHAFNAEKPYGDEYEAANKEMSKIFAKSRKIIASFSPVVTTLLYGMSVAVYVIGLSIITSSAPTERVQVYSDMVAYVSYMGLLITALVNIVMIILYTPMIIYADMRLFAVLGKPDGIPEGERTEGEAEKDGEIEFSHVSFRYPGTKEDAVRDVSFRIKKGQTAAIIGGTGSGKTTLLNLIPRLYDAGAGEVLVNGVNVKDYKLNALRDRIGYVPQTNYLFSGTVRSNIGFGDKNCAFSDEQIAHAAKIGQAEEFISKKEGGFDAQVTTAGSNFSGGQKQRISIARAICRDPKFYIFDDSFSALDFKTDRALRRALKENAGEATVLIVGQRVSTIRNADLIIVMDKGEVVGKGRHDELMEQCSVYRELALSQEGGSKA